MLLYNYCLNFIQSCTCRCSRNGWWKQKHLFKMVCLQDCGQLIIIMCRALLCVSSFSPLEGHKWNQGCRCQLAAEAKYLDDAHLAVRSERSFKNATCFLKCSQLVFPKCSAILRCDACLDKYFEFLIARRNKTGWLDLDEQTEVHVNHQNAQVYFMSFVVIVFALFWQSRQQFKKIFISLQLIIYEEQQFFIQIQDLY